MDYALILQIRILMLNASLTVLEFLHRFNLSYDIFLFKKYTLIIFLNILSEIGFQSQCFIIIQIVLDFKLLGFNFEGGQCVRYILVF